MLSTTNITHIHKHTLTFHVYRKKWKNLHGCVMELLTTKLQWLFCSITNFLELQETKVEIGTVVDVHSSGASDLLRVQLKSSNKGKDVRIWIPFVKDIVPTVDNEAKRIEIRPPEGLLELNVPKEGLTRKDIRKQVGLLSYILCDVFRSRI